MCMATNWVYLRLKLSEEVNQMFALQIVCSSLTLLANCPSSSIISPSGLCMTMLWLMKKGWLALEWVFPCFLTSKPDISYELDRARYVGHNLHGYFVFWLMRWPNSTCMSLHSTTGVDSMHNLLIHELTHWSVFIIYSFAMNDLHWGELVPPHSFSLPDSLNPVPSITSKPDKHIFVELSNNLAD